MMPGQLPIRRVDFPDDLFIKDVELVTNDCGWFEEIFSIKLISYKQFFFVSFLRNKTYDFLTKTYVYTWLKQV